MSEAAPPADQAGRIKDHGRDSRLSFKNYAEHAMRQDFKEIAVQEKCKLQVRDFAECAQEKGLMVIFSCRKQHSAVQECLAKYNSPEEWEKYKAENMERFQEIAQLEHEKPKFYKKPV